MRMCMCMCIQVAELLEQSVRQYCKTTRDETTPRDGMCLKVVGANEYLDDGAVLDYTYIRRCLKKQQEIRSAAPPARHILRCACCMCISLHLLACISLHLLASPCISLISLP